MGKEKYYNEHNDIGPGGLYCPCCNPYHEHPRKSKPKIRRKTRRCRKLDLKKELNRGWR